MVDLGDEHERLAALLSAQGAPFIREFFRSVDLTIGGNKTEIQANGYD